MAQTIHRREAASGKSHKNRISDHIAFALIAYTLMLIFLVTPAIETEGMAIWPYFLLVVLVALMVPFCRKMESRWAKHEENAVDDGSSARGFTFDCCKLWFIALGIPPLIMLGFRVFLG